MKILRTPDDSFENLADYPFRSNYIKIWDSEDQELRIHYIDEGPIDSDPVLLMHGEPTWSYLYRKMIPIITEAGYRAIAPDLVGCGRSDKPADQKDYTYQRHVNWMRDWLNKLHLQRITLVCQDWGGLIGLRLVAENPDQFSRIVAANTGLPTGDTPMPDAFLNWRKYSIEVSDFDVGTIISRGCQMPLTEDVIAAYNAPFPDDKYKEGVRIFPSLVPITPNDPAAQANREAWKVLSNFEKPFVTMFSDNDPITRGGDRILQRQIPGAKDQPHATIEGGGHFLQEDCGIEFSRMIVNFISRTSKSE
jgi:haloalkane dehalogenase